MNVVGKVPMMDLVDRMTTFFRAMEKVAIPARPESSELSIPAAPERVPMMGIVHRTITLLKTSERDPRPIRRKASPAELTAPEQRACRKIEFDLNAAYFLKELTRHPVELLEFESEDECSLPAGIRSLVEQKTARWIIQHHQDRFRKEDKFLFITSHSMEGDQVAIVHHCSDPYKIMEFACTGLREGNRKATQVVAKFKEWDARYGLRFTGIGHDFCEAELLNKNIDYRELSEEIYRFCPSARQGGVSTVELLEEEMKKSGTICLCWD